MELEPRVLVLETIVSRFDQALLKLVDIVSELKVISSNHTNNFVYQEQRLTAVKDTVIANITTVNNNLKDHMAVDEGNFKKLEDALTTQTNVLTSIISKGSDEVNKRLIALESWRWKMLGAMALMGVVGTVIGFLIETIWKMPVVYIGSKP